MIIFMLTWLASVQFSRSVMFNSLGPHELQHTRPPCPSPTPGVHSDSCPMSQWCHPAISPSVVPFSSCPQSLPASCTINWPLRYKVHKDAQIADKTLFLVVSIRVFEKEISNWVSRLDDPPHQCEWASSSIKAQMEQKNKGRQIYSASVWISILPCTLKSVLVVLWSLDLNWNTTGLSSQTKTYTLAPLVLRPSDLKWITPMSFLNQFL